MTFITESRQPRGIGILPLQHENFDQQAWPLDQRVTILAARILRRQLPSESINHLGHYVMDNESVGDLTGGMLWKVEDARPIPGWRFVWPAIHKPFEGAVTGGQQGPGLCLALQNLKILPVRDEEWTRDNRFDVIQPEQPLWPDGEAMWPKFPRGWYGIGLVGTEEKKQIDYFMPTDPRMFAMNFAGDPKFGSMVVDGDNKLGVDQERMARIHSFWRVIKEPEFQQLQPDPETPTGNSASSIPPCDEFGDDDEVNTLAWQLMPHECQHTGWGMVIDQPPGAAFKSGAVPPGTPLRALAANDGGPPYTIGMASHYEGGPFHTGPLYDEHKIGKDADGNHINALHLSTRALWRLPFDPIEPGAPAPPIPTFDGPMMFEEIPYPTDPINPPFETQVVLGYEKENVYTWNCGQVRYGRWRWWSFTGEGASASLARPTFVDSERDYRTRLGYLWTPITRAHTAMMFRPIAPEPGALDMRHAVRGDQWPADRAKLLDCFNRRSPMTIRVEAWARMNQPSNVQWDYSIEPEVGRWPGGTADGGIAFMPPELDILDEDNDFDPQNASLTPSTAYITATRRVFWAVGTPDFSTGAIRSGHRWGRDYTNNRLLFDRVDSSGSVTPQFSLDDNGTTHVLANIALRQEPTLVTANYTLSSATVVYASSTGGAFTLTLPTLGSDTAERTYLIKKIGGGAPNPITVRASGADTIDGVATFILRFDNSSLILHGNFTLGRWGIF